MRVLTSQQMRLAEEQAVEHGIVFLRLMENAGSACAKVIRTDCEILPAQSKNAVILCGTGKNGGDGFVIARKLCDAGFHVRVVLAKGMPADDDAGEMFRKLKNTTAVIVSYVQDSNAAVSAVNDAVLIVDCIFGTGFHGKTEDVLVPLIKTANNSRAKVYAVDIPSGAECNTGKVAGECIRAHKTLAISCVKPAHIVLPASAYCGETVVVDIGIPEICFIGLGKDAFQTADDAEIAAALTPLSPFSHKGSRGHVVSICGSRNMPGAAVLAANAAVSSGAGLVTAVFPLSAYPAISSKLTEPLLFPTSENHAGTFSYSVYESIVESLSKADCVLTGCGLGVNNDTEELVRSILHKTTCPLVLDADALTILSSHPEFFKDRVSARSRIVLTPHPGEMAKLMRVTINEVQTNRLAIAKECARQYNAIAVLKGANTVVASPEGGTVYVNPTGNPGLAKGGSGDMLAGMIASLVAQGMDCYSASRAGVYLHGLCGDEASKKHSVRALTPSLCIREMPKVFKRMETYTPAVYYNIK